MELFEGLICCRGLYIVYMYMYLYKQESKEVQPTKVKLCCVRLKSICTELKVLGSLEPQCTLLMAHFPYGLTFD